MSGEDDAEYEQLMRQAQERARSRGRGDVADYLSLRAANDALRAGGTARLFAAFTALAGEANREGAGIHLARADAHRFAVGNSTMVGSRLTLSVGVRALTVEAGWPRAPRDGFVRGGGLASARVSHFGDPAAGEEMLLLPAGGGAPCWFVIEKTGARTELSDERMRRHLTRLLAGR